MSVWNVQLCIETQGAMLIYPYLIMDPNKIEQVDICSLNSFASMELRISFLGFIYSFDSTP
jgi:hypothetical protein